MCNSPTSHTRTPAIIASAFVLLVFAAGVLAESPVRFDKITLTDEYLCDGINAADFNRDGQTDIVAGPYWYEGPSFTNRHAYYPAVPLDPAESPSNCMSCFPADLNRDGWRDILVIGRVHKHAAYWYENPQGKPGLWPKHYVFERIKGETPPFEDITGDGLPEIICHDETRWGWVAPDWDRPTEPWTFHAITGDGQYGQFYHGTGVGDVNGDGRADLVLNDGWWEHPKHRASEKLWKAHPWRFAEKGGAQMYVHDIDADGHNDIVSVLDAHQWGLAWFRQQESGVDPPFVQHTIMSDRDSESRYGVAFSQPHALDIGDIDGDGLIDIVIGKRRWAHGPEGDVEPNAPPVVHWFQLGHEPNGKVRFRPHLIDDESGVGVQIKVVDVNADGALDVLTSSKLGAFAFINQPAGK